MFNRLASEVERSHRIGFWLGDEKVGSCAVKPCIAFNFTACDF